MKRRTPGLPVTATLGRGESHALKTGLKLWDETLCGRLLLTPEQDTTMTATWELSSGVVTCQRCVKRINKGQGYVEEVR